MPFGGMRLTHGLLERSSSLPAGPAFQIAVEEPVPAPTEKRSGALPACSCVASSVLPVRLSTNCALILMLGYLCSKSSIVFVHAFWTVFGYMSVSVTSSFAAACAGGPAATPVTAAASSATATTNAVSAVGLLIWWIP